MNLESTLEDLEAQGYFASQLKPEQQLSATTCSLVRLSFESETADKYLASPILGKNFIGGFIANQKSQEWLAINLKTISHIENLGGAKLLETAAKLMDILEQHLLQVPVEIGLKQIRVIGKVIARQGNCLCLATADNRLFVVPESSICELVVENLSRHFKL